MLTLRRALTGTLAAAIVAGGFAFASPAYADPNDGQGCAGVKEIPAAFVCVISVTPTGVAPSVTTTSIPVNLPTICYVAGCTSPTTVNVPVPGATPGSGQVAVLYYNGQYTPIAVGTTQLLGIAGTVIDLATGAAGTAVNLVNGAVADVNDAINNIPTREELAQLIVDAFAPVWDEYGPTVMNVLEFVDGLTLQEVVDIVRTIVDRDCPPAVCS